LPVDAQAQDHGVERVAGAVVDTEADPPLDDRQVGDDVAGFSSNMSKIAPSAGTHSPRM
jgi:hypothetical protein